MEDRGDESPGLSPTWSNLKCQEIEGLCMILLGEYQTPSGCWQRMEPRSEVTEEDGGLQAEKCGRKDGERLAYVSGRPQKRWWNCRLQLAGFRGSLFSALEQEEWPPSEKVHLRIVSGQKSRFQLNWWNRGPDLKCEKGWRGSHWQKADSRRMPWLKGNSANGCGKRELLGNYV